jgi:hypothetical protein
MEQKLRFLLLDIDNKHGTIDQQDYIGVVDIRLSQIVAAPGQTITSPIKSGGSKKNKNVGGATLQVTAEELVQCQDTVKMTVSAVVPKKGLMSRPDPFFKVFRQKEGGETVAVYTSEKCKNTTEPLWNLPVLKVQDISNGDRHRPLTFSIYDWESSGDHILIGSVSTTIAEMETKQGVPLEFGIKGGKKNEKIGSFRVHTCQIKEGYSFMQYLKLGVQISLTVAIDFTASNGDPNMPTSLHYRNANTVNEYQSAIMWVGGILQVYDHDDLFPCFGFGAKFPDGKVSHCWAINGNPHAPECSGVQGVLDAYNLALSNVELWGPTNFSPVIQATMERVNQDLTKRKASNPPGPWVYHVLLIMTDGEITDMDSTIRSIVAASALPLSIIIVGVGRGCDFVAMNQLDGDKQALVDTSGRCADRDIVQFVSMSSVANPDPMIMKDQLSKELLAELPSQVVDWFSRRGIVPNKS